VTNKGFLTLFANSSRVERGKGSGPIVWREPWGREKEGGSILYPEKSRITHAKIGEPSIIFGKKGQREDVTWKKEEEGTAA